MDVRCSDVDIISYEYVFLIICTTVDLHFMY